MLTGEMVVDFDRANTEAEEAELLQMLEDLKRRSREPDGRGV